MFKEIFPGWCIQVKSSVIYVDSLWVRVQAHPGVILAAGKHAELPEIQARCRLLLLLLVDW